MHFESAYSIHNFSETQTRSLKKKIEAWSLFIDCRKSSTLIVCRAISFPIFAPMPWGKTTEESEEGGKEKQSSQFSAAPVEKKMVLRVSLLAPLPPTLNQMGMSREEKQKPHFLGCWHRNQTKNGFPSCFSLITFTNIWPFIFWATKKVLSLSVRIKWRRVD